MNPVPGRYYVWFIKMPGQGLWDSYSMRIDLALSCLHAYRAARDMARVTYPQAKIVAVTQFLPEHGPGWLPLGPLGP